MAEDKWIKVSFMGKINEFDDPQRGSIAGCQDDAYATS